MSKKELNDKLSKLEKEFGLCRASSQNEYETILTGLHSLDYVLDRIKIISGGHKIEFYGKESSGKTTMAKKVVAKFQKLNKVCVWIVSESFHEEWARKMGVDTDKLLLQYPESVEEAGDTILKLIGKVDLIVLDSVASLISESELKGTLSDKTRGSQAKAYSEFTRKLYHKIGKSKTVLLFINQIRIVMGKLFGNPEDTPCGRALKHLYDTRIEFKAGKPIDIGKGNKAERIGTELRLYGHKNKLGTAKRRAIVDFYFKDGKFDNVKNLFFSAVKYGIIKRSGAWFEYKKLKEQGKDKLIEKLEDKDWEEIESKIWKNMFGKKESK